MQEPSRHASQCLSERCHPTAQRHSDLSCTPLAARTAFFSKPFVFNIECAALLCAYTRVLASEAPYALAQRDFKRAAGHASPFNSRKAIEDIFATLARRYAGVAHVSLVEFASGNMYGPVPALAALAELGVRRVSLALIDKDYVEWLRKASAHPAAKTANGGSGVGSTLPHAVDWSHAWKEWESRVREAVRPYASEVPLEDYLDAEEEPVRALVSATLEHGGAPDCGRCSTAA